MHDSAREATQQFYLGYCSVIPNNGTVVDIGNYTIDGTIRTIFEERLRYVAIDCVARPTVDIVCSSYSTPFENSSIDCTTSICCFEHDKMFWMSFLEMCRITKVGGFIYITSALEGPYEANPVDCWRFQRDSWMGPKKWAVENGYYLRLMETRLDTQPCADGWKNAVGVFQKVSTVEASYH